MRRNAGGNRVNTAVGVGLTASLFLFGIVLVGVMLLLEEIFGGVDEDEGAKAGAGARVPEAAARPSGVA